MGSEPEPARRGVGRVIAPIRRYLPAIAITLSVVLVLSDWPLGWSLWFEHPFLAALAAGLVLLLLTGSVVDVILRRREARRWVDLGRGAAYALDQVFYLSSIAVVQLLGVWGEMRLSPEIEFHVAPAHARAVALLGPGTDADTDIDVMFEYMETRVAALRDDRLPTLIRDRQWRDHAVFAILALARSQETTIARWIGAFGTLGDNEGFRRIGASIRILDRAEVVVQHLLVIRDAEVVGSQPDRSALDASVQRVVAYWGELVAAYDDEADYWERRHATASGLDIGEHPITQRRGQGRSTTDGDRESRPGA